MNEKEFKKLADEVQRLTRRIESLEQGTNVANISNISQRIIRNIKDNGDYSVPPTGNADKYLIIQVNGIQYIVPAYDNQA